MSNLNQIMLNPNITLPNGYSEIRHQKASEKYIEVIFNYSDGSQWQGWIPTEYRRTGVFLYNENDINEYLNNAYIELDPTKFGEWRQEQMDFWSNKRAGVTQSFFDSLANGGWQCTECTLPTNRNFARRIQDLKEMGYTISTNTNMFCPNCNKNTTHLLLVPISRGSLNGNGYETWSGALRDKIIRVLGSIDVYENRYSTHVLPDHKFPEIRWDDETRSENPNDMTNEEIRDKFQLLSNQRNQQKREVCRNCYQSDQRGTIYGIQYYPVGTETWDQNIPKRGKDAERGCLGCPWYDIEAWRSSLNTRNGLN